jgi:hypothetical protein
MATRDDRPYRDDDDRPRPRDTRAENGPPESGWRPNDEEDRPRDMRRPGPPRQFEEEYEDDRPRRRTRGPNGDHRPDPVQISNALSDTFAHAVEHGAKLLGNNIRAIQDETARFVSHRVERDMAAMEEIARSRSLMELFSVQQRWLTNLTNDYSKGLMRLSRITGAAAEESMESGRRMAEQGRRATEMQ